MTYEEVDENGQYVSYEKYKARVFNKYRIKEHKLKHCPGCKSADVIEVIDDNLESYIKCTNCGIRGPKQVSHRKDFKRPDGTSYVNELGQIARDAWNSLPR